MLALLTELGYMPQFPAYGQRVLERPLGKRTHRGCIDPGARHDELHDIDNQHYPDEFHVCCHEQWKQCGSVK